MSRPEQAKTIVHINLKQYRNYERLVDDVIMDNMFTIIIGIAKCRVHRCSVSSCFELGRYDS